MRRLAALAALCLAASAAVAQTPDSIAWRRYFPLAVGNTWEYAYESYEPPSWLGPGYTAAWTERYRVVARHPRPTDTLYAVARARADVADTVWVRYDDARAAVIFADGYTSLLGGASGGLDAPLGGRRAIGAGIWGQSVSPAPFPSRFVGKQVVNIAGTGGRWIADVGMANAWLGYDGCNAFCGSTAWRLLRATVGGVTYEVGATSVGAERRGVASGLALHPSVTRTSATLHLPVAATVEAFDVTGRRVFHLAAEAGDVHLDVSAWAPGLYVVRAGRETQRLVVAR